MSATDDRAVRRGRIWATTAALDRVHLRIRVKPQLDDWTGSGSRFSGLHRKEVTFGGPQVPDRRRHRSASTRPDRTTALRFNKGRSMGSMSDKRIDGR